jgi:hypothetical protein
MKFTLHREKTVISMVNTEMQKRLIIEKAKSSLAVKNMTLMSSRNKLINVMIETKIE